MKLPVVVTGVAIAGGEIKNDRRAKAVADNAASILFIGLLFPLRDADVLVRI